MWYINVQCLSNSVNLENASASKKRKVPCLDFKMASCLRILLYLLAHACLLLYVCVLRSTCEQAFISVENIWSCGQGVLYTSTYIKQIKLIAGLARTTAKGQVHLAYRISSNKRPGAYLKFRQKGRALIQRRALIKFFFQRTVIYFGSIFIWKKSTTLSM